MADEQLSIILVTVPCQEVAQQLAQDLVKERLAACVNIVSGGEVHLCLGGED